MGCLSTTEGANDLKHIRQPLQVLLPHPAHLLDRPGVRETLVLNRDRRLVPAPRIEGDDHPRRPVTEVEADAPVLEGRSNSQRSTLEPPIALCRLGEDLEQLADADREGLRHRDLEETRRRLVLRTHAPGTLVAHRDRLGPPPGHAVLLHEIPDGIRVFALLRAPGIQDAEPLPPALAGVLPDVGIALAQILGAELFPRLDDVAASGGVALPGLGHASPGGSLLSFVPGHLHPPSGRTTSGLTLPGSPTHGSS